MATSSASPSTASPSESCDPDRPSSPRDTRRPWRPGCSSTPAPRRPSATSSLANSSRRGTSRRLGLDQRDAGAERRVGLRQLALRPGRRRARAAGRAPRRRWSPRGWSTARPRRGRRSAASPASVPVAITTALRGDELARRPPTTRRSPSRRPSPRNSSMPCSSSHGSWPESSRFVITSSRRASTAARVQLAAHRLGRARDPPDLGERLRRAQQRLRGHAGVVGALAADQVALDDRHLEPAVGEPPGADLARRAGPDHDDVELPRAHARQLLQSVRRREVALEEGLGDAEREQRREPEVDRRRRARGCGRGSRGRPAPRACCGPSSGARSRSRRRSGRGS